jgi:integrase
METPDTGLTWIAAAHVRELLSDLATGKVALTHQALAAQPHWRAVAHLRDLLMSCGVLPAADKQLLHFQAWLHRHLAGAPAGPATRLLRQYATWHQLPRLRARAAARPLTPAACTNAISQVKAATRFLAWAAEHHPGPGPARLSQAGPGTWHATCGQGDTASARPFLTWAIKTGHLPSLTLPPVKAPPGGTPITQQRRLGLLRRALTDSQAPVRTRAAACLTLLFAQPPSRIVRLTIDDIIRGEDGQILLRPGDPPAPLPEPFTTLLLQLAASRQNMNTATNPGSRWLFPGRRAGQPLHPATMAALLGEFGIPTRAALTAALRQLVLQAPAPVVAQALGYHHNTAHRHATQAGGPWARYAPGDHAQ